MKIKRRAPSKEPAGTVKRTPRQSVPRERRHKDRAGVVRVSTANRVATRELSAHYNNLTSLSNIAAAVANPFYCQVIIKI